jgi:predicted Fe-Mo cluster-binding NifX family protein
MIVAVTASGNTLESEFDNRFGRAETFILYDTETNTYSVMDNSQNLEAAQGAGVQAAQHVVSSGAKALITGHLGPKAAKVIFTAGLDVYHADADTVSDALAMFKSKALQPLRNADVDGHWV